MTISISSLSTFHKVLLSISVISLIIGLFLHNPISGYETQIQNPSNLSGTASVPCTEAEMAKYRADFDELKKLDIRITEDPAKDQEYIDSEVAACTTRVPETITAPVAEWRTTSPMIFWFGSVINFFQYSFLVVSICLIVGFIFKAKKPA